MKQNVTIVMLYINKKNQSTDQWVFVKTDKLLDEEIGILKMIVIIVIVIIKKSMHFVNHAVQWSLQKFRIKSL